VSLKDSANRGCFFKKVAVCSEDQTVRFRPNSFRTHNHDFTISFGAFLYGLKSLKSILPHRWGDIIH